MKLVIIMFLTYSGMAQSLVFEKIIKKSFQLFETNYLLLDQQVINFNVYLSNYEDLKELNFLNNKRGKFIFNLKSANLSSIISEQFYNLDSAFQNIVKDKVTGEIDASILRFQENTITISLINKNFDQNSYKCTITLHLFDKWKCLIFPKEVEKYFRKVTIVSVFNTKTWNENDFYASLFE